MDGRPGNRMHIKKTDMEKRYKLKEVMETHAHPLVEGTRQLKER